MDRKERNLSEALQSSFSKCIVASELWYGTWITVLMFKSLTISLTFTPIHFDWNPFWISLSDFCELYLPKINYGLLTLQKLSTNLETQSRQLQRGKGSAVTFFYQMIFKQKSRNFWQVGLIPSFIIAVSRRCVFPVYATHVLWVLILEQMVWDYCRDTELPQLFVF